MWEYLEVLILPPLLGPLTHVSPGMSITTARVKRRDIETELASGSLDLAIEIPMTMSDRIRQKWLLNEPFVVIARRGHPAIGGILDLDTYLAQRHIAGLLPSQRSQSDRRRAQPTGISPTGLSAQPTQFHGLHGGKQNRLAVDVTGAPCAVAEYGIDEPSVPLSAPRPPSGSPLTLARECRE